MKANTFFDQCNEAMKQQLVLQKMNIFGETEEQSINTASAVIGVTEGITKHQLQNVELYFDETFIPDEYALLTSMAPRPLNDISKEIVAFALNYSIEFSLNDTEEDLIIQIVNKAFKQQTNNYAEAIYFYLNYTEGLSCDRKEFIKYFRPDRNYLRLLVNENRQLDSAELEFLSNLAPQSAENMQLLHLYSLTPELTPLVAQCIDKSISLQDTIEFCNSLSAFKACLTLKLANKFSLNTFRQMANENKAEPYALRLLNDQADEMTMLLCGRDDFEQTYALSSGLTVELLRPYADHPNLIQIMHIMKQDLLTNAQLAQYLRLSFEIQKACFDDLNGLSHDIPLYTQLLRKISKSFGVIQPESSEAVTLAEDNMLHNFIEYLYLNRDNSSTKAECRKFLSANLVSTSLVTSKIFEQTLGTSFVSYAQYCYVLLFARIQYICKRNNVECHLCSLDSITEFSNVVTLMTKTATYLFTTDDLILRNAAFFAQIEQLIVANKGIWVEPVANKGVILHFDCKIANAKRSKTALPIVITSLDRWAVSNEILISYAETINSYNYNLLCKKLRESQYATEQLEQFMQNKPLHDYDSAFSFLLQNESLLPAFTKVAIPDILSIVQEFLIGKISYGEALYKLVLYILRTQPLFVIRQRGDSLKGIDINLLQFQIFLGRTQLEVKQTQFLSKILSILKHSSVDSKTEVYIVVSLQKKYFAVIFS